MSGSCNNLPKTKPSNWCKRKIILKNGLKILVSILGDVDPARCSCRLGSAGQVDSVAKETIARHPLADDSRHYLAAVDADRDLLQMNFVDGHIRDSRLVIAGDVTSEFLVKCRYASL